MEWNETALKQLGIYWNEGLSSAEIGRKLGCSKNAVLGKVHRLQLASRPSPIQPATEESKAKKERARSRLTASEIIRLPKPQPEQKRALRLFVGQEKDCQWPSDVFGEEICTEPRVIGKPYCACHCARAYVRRAA